MRLLLLIVCLLGALDFTSMRVVAGSAVAETKIIKVLPTLLDHKGRNSLSPSLYERDAYQAILRKNRDQVGGVRFDVQWKARGVASKTVVLRLELRTRGHADAKPEVIDTEVVPKRFGTKWSRVVVDAETYKRIGEVVAWRATVVDGGQTLAQRTSFLW